MKNLSKLFFISLLLSQNAFAVKLTIYGPCSDEPLLKVEQAFNQKISVGDFTINQLEQNAIPYQGDSSGINSIYDTPTGTSAIEIVSDVKMRAYGWCYHVDGVEPAEMPDTVFVTSHDTVVKWFFAYSTYENGKWLNDYCMPAHSLKPKFLCAE